MRIHLYTLSWNEEKMMPFFLKHYSKFCEKIVVFDNESSDSTPEIVKSFPNTELRTWSSNNQINDQMYLDIKNSAYKESRGQADWVIVCDTDEFLYHPNLMKKLEQYKKTGINYPQVKGFEMMPNCELSPDDNLCEKYQMGARFTNLDKRAIFDPNLDIEYYAGCHTAKLPMGSVESPTADIRLMHYKMLNQQYFVERHQILAKRLSDFNKSRGWGGHYTWNEQKMIDVYNDFLSKVVQVI